MIPAPYIGAHPMYNMVASAIQDEFTQANEEYYPITVDDCNLFILWRKGGKWCEMLNDAKMAYHDVEKYCGAPEYDRFPGKSKFVRAWRYVWKTKNLV